MATLEFLDDAAEFLAVASDRLAADPVLSVMVTRVTSRIQEDDVAGVPPPSGFPRWWAVVREDKDVVGLAMRTAPFDPYPPYLLPMPDAAAVELARELHGRGERVTAALGALPAARVFADETARLAGGRVEVGMRMRLFELGELRPPCPVPGELRRARPDEVGLVHEWLELFMADADEMAGRPRGASPHEAPEPEELARRIERGTYWFWVDGRPVNLTAASTPSFGVAGVGPVFTPAEHRGNGYASAAVAGVSRRLLDLGARVCLFTDQANPTSNRIYQALGFDPVVDMANLVVEP